jgi:hypothetical protein
MALSLRGFKVAMYEEHLEEIAFLHAQCAALRADRRRGWQDAAPFEDRLEAHLDALVLGGRLAQDTALARSDEAEPGELFATTALLCRLGEARPLQALLAGPAWEDAGKATAMAQALQLEWPQAWQAACVSGIAQGDARLVPALLAVAQLRGWPLGDALAKALAAAAPARLPALLEFVGRVEADAPLLQAWTTNDDAVLSVAAVQAGLRLHDEDARRLATAASAPPALRALAGGRGTAQLLLESLPAASEPAQAVVLVRALGQLGELSAVRALTGLLADEALAPEAALALHLITGGEPRETVLEPEAVDEDLLTEAELRRWRESGEAPRRADGQPFGDRVDRLSQDPAVWGQWLVDNGSRFQAGLRYRLGLPCSADALLRSLASSAVPAPARPALADELLVRHGLVRRWQPLLPVTWQWRLMRETAPEARSRPQPAGAWHWADQPLAG